MTRLGLAAEAKSSQHLIDPLRRGRLPRIDIDRCTGCGRCVAACDLRLLSLEVVRWEKFAALNEPQACTGCSACAVKCPFHAIAMRKETRTAAPDADAGLDESAEPTR